MNPSGKTASRAPRAPASAMREQAFSTVAARSRKTGDAWTAATRNGSPLMGLPYLIISSALRLPSRHEGALLLLASPVLSPHAVRESHGEDISRAFAWDRRGPDPEDPDLG